MVATALASQSVAEDMIRQATSCKTITLLTPLLQPSHQPCFIRSMWLVTLGISL